MGFTASINSKAQTLSTLSSASSSCIAYDRYLCNNDVIKLIFNVNKRTLQCILNEHKVQTTKQQQIIVHNIETNKAKYHLAIAMCGKYSVRLLDFKRIKSNQMHSTSKQDYINAQKNKKKNLAILKLVFYQKRFGQSITQRII